MRTLVRRYAHVPLGVVTLFVILTAIGWLVIRRVDPLRDAAPESASADAVLVAEAPLAPEPSRATAPDPPAADPLPVAASARPPSPPGALRPAGPAERYALESGPFTSADLADRREDELNRLGYATVRFRKQTATRLYVVTVTGLGSVEDADRAARALGGGRVIEVDGGAEVVLDRLPSLREAVAAARAVRERGFEVQVAEDVTPTVIYHIRYGQFASPAAARARGEELARMGLENRVVKVR